MSIDEHGIAAFAPDGLHAAAVSTDVHPGFMTDWQTPLMVLFTQAEGMSVLHETVYEERFVYVPALQAMGGEIELFATCLGGAACRFHDTSYLHSAVVRGPSKLQGTDVEVPDVRAGFSSVIAAAAASGPTLLRGVHHLERGYHRPAEQLRSLGLILRAALRRLPGPKYDRRTGGGMPVLQSRSRGRRGYPPRAQSTTGRESRRDGFSIADDPGINCIVLSKGLHLIYRCTPTSCGSGSSVTPKRAARLPGSLAPALSIPQCCPRHAPLGPARACWR